MLDDSYQRYLAYTTAMLPIAGISASQRPELSAPFACDRITGDQR